MIIIKYVVFDFETTGLSPTNDEPTQLAYAILNENLEIIDKGNFYFKVAQRIPRKITELTGITNKMLNERGVEILDVIDIIESIFEDSIVVGHNVRFDLNFLNFHFDIRPKKFIDTLLISKIELPLLPNNKLETVASYQKVELNNAHNALNDVMATAGIMQRFKKQNVDFEKYINKTKSSDVK